jgi:hypothetical protein
VEALRALPRLRGYTLLAAFVVAAGAYAYMGIEGHIGEVLGAIFIQLLLVNIALPDVSREARRWLTLVAALLALAALSLGVFIGSLA